MEDYKVVIQREPGNYEVHNNLGAALDALGEEEEAID